MMPSDAFPSASVMVQQATSLGSMVVTTENPDLSRKSNFFSHMPERSGGQIPATPSVSFRTDKGDKILVGSSNSCKV
jgi:hypothetical protein